MKSRYISDIFPVSFLRMRNRILPPHIYTARESEAVSIVTADFVHFRLDLLQLLLFVFLIVLQCSDFVILGRITPDHAKGWWVLVLSSVSL